MNNLREVKDDLLKEWIEFREETAFCQMTPQDKKYCIYFDEIAETFPGDVVEKTEDGEYELCKLAEGNYCYIMVRIDNTIIYGSCKNDYQPVFDWLYGLGYVTK